MLFLSYDVRSESFSTGGRLVACPDMSVVRQKRTYDRVLLPKDSRSSEGSF